MSPFSILLHYLKVMSPLAELVSNAGVAEMLARYLGIAIKASQVEFVFLRTVPWKKLDFECNGHGLLKTGRR